VIAELFSVLAPVYLCIGVGYIWHRLGRRSDNELLADLCMNVGAPCLIFTSLVDLEVAASALGGLAAAILLAHALFALIGGLALRVAGLPPSSFLAPVIFPNTGNMGLPVALFAFGEEGLAYGVIFFVISTTAHFTLGQWAWTGRASLSQLARTPLSYAAVLGLLAMATDVSLPSWLMRTTDVLGDFTIPLMQFMLGVSLAELGIGNRTRSATVAGLRLGLGVGVGVTLAGLFGLSGAARGVFILDCAMPIAVVNALFAVKHGRPAGEVAGAVVISTTVSFLILPVILAWVL